MGADVFLVAACIPAIQEVDDVDIEGFTTGESELQGHEDSFKQLIWLGIAAICITV
jgi:hypothetical protein